LNGVSGDILLKEFNTENAPAGSWQAPSREHGGERTARSENPPLQKATRALAGETVFLRIKQLGEARVFLEESEILVVRA